MKAITAISASLIFFTLSALASAEDFFPRPIRSGLTRCSAMTWFTIPVMFYRACRSTTA